MLGLRVVLGKCSAVSIAAEIGKSASVYGVQQQGEVEHSCRVFDGTIKDTQKIAASTVRVWYVCLCLMGV